MKANRFALLWLMVATLVVGHNAWLWFVQRVVPDSDILALLPVQERDPVLQQSFPTSRPRPHEAEAERAGLDGRATAHAISE